MKNIIKLFIAIAFGFIMFHLPLKAEAANCTVGCTSENAIGTILSSTGSIVIPANGSSVTFTLVKPPQIAIEYLNTINDGHPLYVNLVNTHNEGCNCASYGKLTTYNVSTNSVTFQSISTTNGGQTAANPYIQVLGPNDSSSSGGAVNSVTASSPLSSTGGATPNITFTGILGLSNGGTANNLSGQIGCLDNLSGNQIAVTSSHCLGGTTASFFVIPAIGSNVDISLADTHFTPNNNTSVTISDNTNCMNGYIISGAGTYTITVRNTGLCAGSVGNQMNGNALVSPGASFSSAISSGGGSVNSVTGSGNVASSGGANPNLTITGQIPETNGGTGVSSISTGCVDSFNFGRLAGTTAHCLGGTTGGSFVIPPVGSSVNISLNDNNFIQQDHVGITISDGNHCMSGFETSGSGSYTIAVTNVGICAGSVGGTMVGGALVTPGASFSSAPAASAGNFSIGLGYLPGILYTTTAYPHVQVPNYSGTLTLTGLRLTSVNPDDGTTVFGLYKNGTQVSTISFSNAATTAYLAISPAISVVPGDVLYVQCSTAGAATSVSIQVEGL